MKSSALRVSLLALAIFLFGWQPANAGGCGQKCGNGALCERNPADPGLGCFQEDVSCWEYICDLSVTPDPDLTRQIAAAAKAGDTRSVERLAAAFGQPFRLYSQGQLVYDGLAGAERGAACSGQNAPAAPEAADVP